MPVPESSTAAVTVAQKRILVVDDDIIISMNTAALLEELGYEAVEANSGAEALERLRSDPEFDLLLTDQAMPGMRGSELIAEARKLRPEIQVLMATGYDDAPDERTSEILRLAKPFGLPELEAAVEALLAADRSFDETDLG